MTDRERLTFVFFTAFVFALTVYGSERAHPTRPAPDADERLLMLNRE